MSDISRSALFGKLNNLGYKAIESATVFCKMRGNPYVELVHWLHQILQLPDSDLHHIIRHFECEPARLAKDLTQSLDKLPAGLLRYRIYQCMWRMRSNVVGYTARLCFARPKSALAI